MVIRKRRKLKMTVQINRFEVKKMGSISSSSESKTAQIKDHKDDMIIVTVKYHKSFEKNKELAEKIIPIIEAEIEEEDVVEP